MDKIGGKTSAKEQLLSAKKELEAVIKSSHCNPILVRLAWHDSGTYDKVSLSLWSEECARTRVKNSLVLSRSAAIHKERQEPYSVLETCCA